MELAQKLLICVFWVSISALAFDPARPLPFPTEKPFPDPSDASVQEFLQQIQEMSVYDWNAGGSIEIGIKLRFARLFEATKIFHLLDVYAKRARTTTELRDVGKKERDLVLAMMKDAIKNYVHLPGPAKKEMQKKVKSFLSDGGANARVLGHMIGKLAASHYAEALAYTLLIRETKFDSGFEHEGVLCIVNISNELRGNPILYAKEIKPFQERVTDFLNDKIGFEGLRFLIVSAAAHQPGESIESVVSLCHIIQSLYVSKVSPELYAYLTTHVLPILDKYLVPDNHAQESYYEAGLAAYLLGSHNPEAKLALIELRGGGGSTAATRFAHQAVAVNIVRQHQHLDNDGPAPLCDAVRTLLVSLPPE